MKYTHNRLIILCSNIFWVIYLSLILLNTSWGIYSVQEESKNEVVFLSINNETQYLPFVFLSSRFMTYVLSFIIVKLFLEKKPLNLGS